jgi:murein DD-endopeptidase MepM/ murein hydrolase activator NlpD
MFGQRFAYDFCKFDATDEKNIRWHRESKWRSLLLGVRLEQALSWSQPILSPFDAEVIEAYDGWRERNPVHIVRDLVVAIKNGIRTNHTSNADLVPLLGNYLILKGRGTYCLIAHARCGSLKVQVGAKVSEGEKVAEVGHSGNSTAPHLHFQLMDRAELIHAKGVPCAFRNYEAYDGGAWTGVREGIPNRMQRIRV